MNDPPLRSEGGMAAVLAGLLLPLGHLANLGGDPATGTVLGKLLVLLAHVTLVFAFVGIYATQHTWSETPVGRVGMILSVLGTVFVAAIVFVELAGTTAVDTTPVFTAAGTAPIYTVGPLLFVVGLVLVGGSILRGASLPGWSGGLLIGGTVVFATASGLTAVASVLTIIGGLMTGGGFIWAGAALLFDQPPPAQETQVG